MIIIIISYNSIIDNWSVMVAMPDSICEHRSSEFTVMVLTKRSNSECMLACTLLQKLD